ncbi:MAG: prolipoprotein diacylglyceryl transferase [Candidatus Nanopelagicales bacterium]
MDLIAFIPSPSQGTWNLGPLPLRAYALLIILGIVVAIWVGSKRYVARGGSAGVIGDIALWAVPFGIIGGRLYHVVSDWQLYFAPGGSGIVGALRIWDGGLGIWGAVALGGLGAWIGARRLGVALPPIADAIAPGIALAQAIGRWGNWFNQELFGAPTTLPWGLEIAPQFRPEGYAEFETFHPTFLYESLWMLAVALVLIWADKRFRMGHGRVFALYVLLYTLGRVWIEYLRIDTANTILGVRLNVWTSILVGLGALIYLIVSARMRPGREEVFPPAKYVERERLEQIREAKAAPKEAARVVEVTPGDQASSAEEAAPPKDASASDGPDEVDTSGRRP